MKAITRILPVLALVFACSASAQESTVRLYCEACRDIVEHPEDARNFGVNQLYGASSWLSFEQADRFVILDSFGNQATVDINIRYVVLDISFFWADLPYAISFVLQVRIVYPSGDIVTYRFDMMDLDAVGALPVPASGTTVSVTDDPEPRADDSDEGDEGDERDDGGLADDDEGWADFEPEDGSCGACEVYFDADEDGFLDDEPVEWIEEL